MKKPNLSQGNWFSDSLNPSSDWGLNWSVKSKLSQHPNIVISPVVFHEADAKAIAQVPNMIDALIEAHGIIKEYLEMNGAIGEGDVHDVTEWELEYYYRCDEKVMEIEQVLTEAGCEL